VLSNTVKYILETFKHDFLSMCPRREQYDLETDARKPPTLLAQSNPDPSWARRDKTTGLSLHFTAGKTQ